MYNSFNSDEGIHFQYNDSYFFHSYGAWESLFKRCEIFHLYCLKSSQCIWPKNKFLDYYRALLKCSCIALLKITTKSIELKMLLITVKTRCEHTDQVLQVFFSLFLFMFFILLLFFFSLLLFLS